MPRSVVDASSLRAYSVTAPAIASSRQALKARNSSALMGASVSVASSVTDWQTPP